MSVECETKLLGDLLELIIDHRGKTPNKMGFDDFHNEGHPVLSAKHVKTDGLVNADSIRFANENMYKKWMKVEIEEGDIALTSEAPMGEVFYLDGKIKYVLGQRVFGLRVKRKLINPKYLVAWLTSWRGQEQLIARASGSTVLGIRQSELVKIEVDLPPMGVQEQIAKIRFDLSDKIELNRQTNQTLEQIAQAIFKSWFVDFDPVRAKIAAREAFIQQHPEVTEEAIRAAASTEGDTLAHAAAKACERAAISAISGKTEEQLNGLSADTLQQLKATAVLFPDTLVELELGDLPDGWKYMKAMDVADVAIGKTPPRKEPEWFSENPNDVRWASIRDLGSSGLYVQNTNEYLTEGAVKKFNIRRIPDDTVLLSFKLTVGRVAITDGEMLSNEAIAHFVLGNDSRLSPEYLYLYLQNFDYQNLGSTSSIATAVNSKMIKDMPILVPSKNIAQAFYTYVSSCFSEIKCNLNQIQSLSSMRDLLLPELLSGGVEVKSGAS